MRGGMLAGCTHNRPATRNGRLESASKRASTNNEDRTMNSGAGLCQSGSRSAKTVATHCNVQTAPRSAQAVHFGLLQSSRTCPVSATRSPQHDGPGCTAPAVVRTTTQRMIHLQEDHGGAPRRACQRKELHGKLRRLQTQPTNACTKNRHNLIRARCAATRNRQHTTHQRACRFGHQNDMRAYYTQPQATDAREPIERPRRPIRFNAEPKMKANRLKAAVGAGIRGRAGARRNQVWSPACPWANSANHGSSQNTPAQPTEQSGGSRNSAGDNSE